VSVADRAASKTNRLARLGWLFADHGPARPVHDNQHARAPPPSLRAKFKFAAVLICSPVVWRGSRLFPIGLAGSDNDTSQWRRAAAAMPATRVRAFALRAGRIVSGRAARNSANAAQKILALMVSAPAGRRPVQWQMMMMMMILLISGCSRLRRARWP
jgi:hypothetical protein